MNNENITIKKCRVCGKILNVEAFNMHNTSKDGYVHSCKSCKAQLKSNRLNDIEEPNPVFSKYSASELIQELRARGYKIRFVRFNN